MRNFWSFFLVGLVVLGLAGCLYIFLRPNYQFRVELLSPKPDAVIGNPFSVSFFYVGPVKPSQFLAVVDGKIHSPQGAYMEEEKSWGRYRSGTVIGMTFDIPDLEAGWHDLSVKLVAGGRAYPSDTVRAYHLPPATANRRNEEEAIGRTRRFFQEPFNDFVIANYNSYVYKQRGQAPRDAEYRQSWEAVLQAQINDRIKAPIRSYIDQAQKYIDDEASVNSGSIHLPIDLLNQALMGEGLPFYAYLYYKHFPIVCEITDTLSVQLDARTYPVYILEQISRISGGWTPPTLYGHSHSLNAVIHDELHRTKTEAMLACLQGNEKTCEDWFNYALREMPYSKQHYITEKVREELQQYFRQPVDSLRLEKLHRLNLQSTAIHEAVHLEEHYQGVAVATSVIFLVDGFQIRPMDANNIEHVTQAARRSAVNMRGQSVEYNAYLTELVHAKGLKRQLLTHIYNNARSDYESRLILASIGKKAEIWSNTDLIYKSWESNANTWEDLLIELLDIPVAELQNHLQELYIEDYGALRVVSAN